MHETKCTQTTISLCLQCSAKKEPTNFTYYKDHAQKTYTFSNIHLIKINKDIFHSFFCFSRVVTMEQPLLFKNIHFEKCLKSGFEYPKCFKCTSITI